MARYFAQIDDRNIVQRVIVVSNEDCVDSNNAHNEEVGIAFCKLLIQDPSSKWKESFKDGSQRRRLLRELDIHMILLAMLIFPLNHSLLGL